MKGGGKKRFVLESSPNDVVSAFDANAGNGIDHGHYAPLGQIDQTLLQSAVGEATPLKQSEEAAETEVAEEEEQKEDGDEVAEEGERPRTDLADGFFEIEAIRRKRVKKGQTQYLIKWRDWPETANTWEPLENLSAVSDVIDSFEDSLKSGKQRKRKRKHVVYSTQPKKRLQRSITPYSLRRFTVSAPDNHQQSASAGHPVFAALPQTVLFADEGENNGDVSSCGKGKQVTENGSTSVPKQVSDRREENDYDPKLSELKATSSMATSGVDAERHGIHVQGAKNPIGNSHMDGPSKVDGMEPVQNDRCRGAKKRKSGSVKRFTKEPRVSDPLDAQRVINISGGAVEQSQGEAAGCVGNNGHNYQLEEANDIPTIVKIIKPTGYSASLSSNIQEVSVTFLALRSDGAEVMVDNKYLKSSNPHLLINYYEQHLRYSPS
ncbi:hypothetical protein L6164_002783 [Bauhinia variegata]|uniref:Uncharacterized protein n=1 Tax=Bauhinia variegata TaxID=167791 RepID=A0ACB9PYQ9_BAUVA|nr:hypothetical protein L6164_002783 [Bauhinia variegata]